MALKTFKITMETDKGLFDCTRVISYTEGMSRQTLDLVIDSEIARGADRLKKCYVDYELDNFWRALKVLSIIN